MASIEREREAIKKALSFYTDLDSLNKFCEKISRRLDNVSFEEKQKIIHLLNIEGRVKDSIITLTGCITSDNDCCQRTTEFASLHSQRQKSIVMKWPLKRSL